MPTCAAGHVTSAQDYCEVCGRELASAPPSDGGTPWWRGIDVEPARAASAGRPERPSTVGEPVAVAAEQPAAERGRCLECDTPRSGRFCEECGSDSFVGAPAAPDRRAVVSWHALVTVDRDQFEAVVARDGPDAGTLVLPGAREPRRVALTAAEIHLGRRSRSAAIQPDIDLSDDPGVSQRHARLTRVDADHWELVDLGSTNGTALDDGRVLAPHTPTLLGDGARILLGAWTAVELRSETAR
ncbi:MULTISPECIES: FHA domain-containing protein [Actinoalloteichus]|uniref:FHA domain-containing protein n=1 Tax=Actinoalloteichus fjordicus TaxID=1612552 RepID=A0AAC9LBP3_9PSEU|nr:MULTISPECIES: FHA domain-containing protein [Actinoalloteichus]APU14396.1 FHA domain-containing protein [Actinoalloteichus fjordicus]APU20365.1 FHA domain-containing protein [Actinoalloteichus sp. GBA129-24]